MARIERIKEDAEKYGGPFHPYKLDLGEGGTFAFSGLSLRDWFAGQAIGSIIIQCAADTRFNKIDMSIEEYFASKAYAVADAMLKARKGEL